ncbi:MAG: response regulator [Anaerolineae bacterium]|nr:response regulator [Anaerolineae bacterium]
MAEKRQSILVIDDDVQLVDTVKTLLEAVGYQVLYAYQAEKGLEIARQHKPDLILLDVMFAGPPGPDGIELSRRINQDADLRGIPVIILSGVRKVLDYPFRIAPDETWMPVKAFLEKPITPSRLLAEIEKILGPRG